MPHSAITRAPLPADLAQLTVAHCMTPDPTTIGSDRMVADALDLMERRRVRHLPVLDGDRLVGLLSERHLRDAMPSLLTIPDPSARHRTLAVTPIMKVAIEHPATIRPDAPLVQAIARMRRLRAGSLPVVHLGRLVGILTSGDLLSLLERILEAGRPETPSP